MKIKPKYAPMLDDVYNEFQNAEICRKLIIADLMEQRAAAMNDPPQTLTAKHAAMQLELLASAATAIAEALLSSPRPKEIKRCYSIMGMLTTAARVARDDAMGRTAPILPTPWAKPAQQEPARQLWVAETSTPYRATAN
jgi:hypothetical protein